MLGIHCKTDRKSRELSHVIFCVIRDFPLSFKSAKDLITKRAVGIVNVSPSFYPLGGTVFVRIDDGGEIFLMFHTRNRPNMQLAECDFAPFANFRDPKIEEEKILTEKKRLRKK